MTNKEELFLEDNTKKTIKKRSEKFKKHSMAEVFGCKESPNQEYGEASQGDLVLLIVKNGYNNKVLLEHPTEKRQFILVDPDSVHKGLLDKCLGDNIQVKVLETNHKEIRVSYLQWLLDYYLEGTVSLTNLNTVYGGFEADMLYSVLGKIYNTKVFVPGSRVFTEVDKQKDYTSMLNFVENTGKVFSIVNKISDKGKYNIVMSIQDELIMTQEDVSNYLDWHDLFLKDCSFTVPVAISQDPDDRFYECWTWNEDTQQIISSRYYTNEKLELGSLLQKEGLEFIYDKYNDLLLIG